MEFNKDKTVAIIFDTEWYVPAEDRGASLTSLKANPAKQSHRYLGGVFTRFYPLRDDVKPHTREIWAEGLTDSGERSALRKTYSFFSDSWKMLEGKDNSDPDLITIGTGISRLDLPGLYVKSLTHGLDKSANLYETFMKTKIVDLDEAAIPYLDKNTPRMLYPVATNRIVSRFKIDAPRKETGKKVWDMIDSGNLDDVKLRTAGEVKVLTNIYNKLVEQIFKVKH